MSGPALAIRARTIIPLTGEEPARGVQLFAALKKIDNGVLLIQDGLIADVLSFKNARLPVGCQVRDIGSVCLVPACVNAHVHLQLSFLAGRTAWGKGFTAWLASMIPQLGLASPDAMLVALRNACEDLAATGTGYVGDIAGSVDGGLAPAHQACADAGLVVSHFCEWFGFMEPLADSVPPWPKRVRADLERHPALADGCQPSGHALYSTAPAILQAAHDYCVRNHRVFCLHLAESSEEVQLLTAGTGALYELYAGKVLPAAWHAPRMRPLAYAASLGLLGPGALAVHGTQLDDQEVEVLAASGTSLCLCPRSNRNLGVGTPPVRTLMENGSLLCLGTDGLSSNTDLDVRQEAVYLRESLDIPPEALLRMLTVNGVAALGVTDPGAGRLRPGCAAKFCILPEALTY